MKQIAYYMQPMLPAKFTFYHLKIIAMVRDFQNVQMLSKTKLGVWPQKDNNAWTSLSITHLRKRKRSIDMTGIMI